MSFSKITIIGSGNVAFHFVRQMQRMELPLVEVVARPSKALRDIVKKFKVSSQSDFSKIKKHSGIYLLAVSDDAIVKVAKSLPKSILTKCNLVHTSGATASTVLKKYGKAYGAFWPLQSFSKSRKVNFKGLPFLITASSPVLQKKLIHLAEALGGTSQVVNDKERLRYHCAAVLVNNFTNHLYAEAEHFLAQQKLPFEVLHPLMLETVKKAMEIGPKAAQTGPAKRGDEKTMQRHLRLLQKDAEMAEIYRKLSERINAKNS